MRVKMVLTGMLEDIENYFNNPYGTQCETVAEVKVFRNLEWLREIVTDVHVLFCSTREPNKCKQRARDCHVCCSGQAVSGRLYGLQ